jgi:hypothetical protein
MVVNRVYNTLYVVDDNCHNVRQVTLGNGTAAGVYVKTLAGSTTSVYGTLDGVGTNALFWSPRGITISGDGFTLYVAENADIRTINIATQQTGRLVGGGNYFGINWVAPANGYLQGQLGYFDGFGTNALFYNPQTLYISKGDPDTLYVGEYNVGRVRYVSLSTTLTGTLGGNSGNVNDNNLGTGTNAYFYGPVGLVVNSAGTMAYVANLYTATGRGYINRVQIRPAVSKAPPIGNVQVLVGGSAYPPVCRGTGAPLVTSGVYLNNHGTSAPFTQVDYLALSPDSTTLYMSEFNWNQLRRVNIASRNVTVLVGAATTAVCGTQDGPLSAARLSSPSALTVNAGGTKIYFIDQNVCSPIYLSYQVRFHCCGPHTCLAS